ncbi:SMI1/KNR4 family protein [Streptomyces sp. NPDC005573]|uniref:SMI1/KNR4 family protein n=1 Tax=Streptomyces sp. NPDC005573 TaxID=3156890 RepID=UPI0033B175E9
MADIDDWHSFLAQWSQEWEDAQDGGAPAAPAPEDGPAGTDTLGFPPASEERILALEERLGHRLPPSYRAFVAVSDGWRHAGGFVWRLAGTGEVRWHEDAEGLSEYFPGEPDDEPTPEDALLAGMWSRSLQLDVQSDGVYVLLDPGDTDGDGEWAVYTYASWRASPPERLPSFGAFMRDMYQEFHRLEVDRSSREGRGFANATTRALDEAVEAARRDALAGRYERASAALAEAVAYGRPRAQGLRDQIRRFLGETYMVYFPGLAADPLYAPEILPVLAAEHARHHRDETHALSFARSVGVPADGPADDALRRVRAGTCRYAPEGPFGLAVEEAREQARWGDTDAAWRTLRGALGAWRPLGPDHLAPVGLCADPVLGPLLTVERGRELLATPRAGRQGETPVPSGDLDPPGLAWLADGEQGVFRASYRFVLVESVEPAALPGLLGADGTTTVLNEPMTLWDARMRLRENGSSWEDRALTAVGRAGPGWSFAVEPGPGGRFSEKRFVSPGAAASRGTRAVTVWCEPGDPHRPGVFQLSVARDGVEQYGFTVRGEEVTGQGAIPDVLDPHRLFQEDGPASGRLGERRALEALTALFGVRLPRFALAHGRLHSFRTRPWNRAPGPGEGYMTVRVVHGTP